MTRMLFRVSQLTFIQKQSIILDYNIQIYNLKERDKIFLAGPLGNYSLAGFQMVRVWALSRNIHTLHVHRTPLNTATLASPASLLKRKTPDITIWWRFTAYSG